MNKAIGKPAYEIAAALWDVPAVHREVTKLQLLNHLTGQGDRHNGNYFINIWIGEDGEIHAAVTGIDNDQCFGHKLTDPNEIRRAFDPKHYGNRGTALPALIDTEMAAVIRSIMPTDLTEMLKDKLNPAEIKASIIRLDGVKTHIDWLETRDRIITPDKWGAPELPQKVSSQDSYWARERLGAIEALYLSTQQAQMQAMLLAMQPAAAEPIGDAQVPLPDENAQWQLPAAHQVVAW